MGKLIVSGRQGFMEAFGKHPTCKKHFIPTQPLLMNDTGKLVTTTGDRDSEGRVRTMRPKLLGLLTETIKEANMNHDEIESLLNILARDLLPRHFFSKIREVGSY